MGWSCVDLRCECRSTRVSRSRLTHLTRVLRLRKTRVVRLRKTRVKYDTMSDFPLLPLGKEYP